MSYDAPPREEQAAEVAHESAPERDYAAEPREPAPERDYAAEAPRPQPAEAESVGSAPEETEARGRATTDGWPPQERSFSEAPRHAGEQSAPESGGESAPVPSNERQAG